MQEIVQLKFSENCGKLLTFVIVNFKNYHILMTGHPIKAKSDYRVLFESTVRDLLSADYVKFCFTSDNLAKIVTLAVD